MPTYLILLLSLVVVAILTIAAIYRRKSKPSIGARQAYIDGLRSLIDDDHQNAFIKLRQAVNEDVDNIDAYLKLGDLFRKRGMHDKALQIHKELLLRQTLSPEIEPEIQKSLAQDFAVSGYNDKAIDLLENLKKNPNHKTWASQKLLDIHIANKKWNDAVAVLNGYGKRDSSRDSTKLANLKILVGQELLQNREYHKARLQFKEAISINDISPLPYLFIAQSYIDENRIEDAYDFLKKLCQKMPKYAYLGYPMIEQTLFHLGRFGEVESLYRSVLEQDPANAMAKISLAQILMKKNEFQQAETLLRSVLENNPADSQAAVCLAEIYSSQRRPKEAIEVLTSLTSRAVSRSQSFRCQICGFSVTEPAALCSNCGNLGTYF